MKQTVVFLGVSWEVVGAVDNLDVGCFAFLPDRTGKCHIVIHTEDWIPDKTKCSPRYKKYYGKYLLKDISHMPFEKQSKFVDSLIHSGHKVKNGEITKEQIPVYVTPQV